MSCRDNFKAATSWPDLNTKGTVIDITSTSTRSSTAVLDKNKTYILVASEDCWVDFGDSSVTVAGTDGNFSLALSAGMATIVGPMGNTDSTNDAWYVCAIHGPSAIDGKLSICPMNR